MKFTIQKKTIKNIIIFFSSAAVFTLITFFLNSAQGTSADILKVKEWIQKGALIVDVRTQEEFNSGNYKGSINIPLAELENNLKIFGSKEQFIIVYCRSGNRSGQAKMILEKHGFKNVINGGGLKDMP